LINFINISLTRTLTRLKFAKAAAPEPQVRRFFLPQLLTEVVSEFATLTQDKGQSVEASCSEEVAYIIANRTKIRS
jgi:hypothetical protein